MIKKLNHKVRVTGNTSLFHDSREAVKILAKTVNELHDKVNELVEKINTL